MWNGDYRTQTRIVLEAKGKAPERRCSLQSEPETEEEKNKKIPAVQFETVKQARQDNKSGKTYSTVVALTDVHEAAAGKDTTTNERCKHCGHLQIKTIMHIGSMVLYAKWHRIFL